jgi:mono/diheme cytochrome c family protein/glucose/arabinose dehydrogenase
MRMQLKLNLHSLGTVLLGFLFGVGVCFGQQGDREGHKMSDPIPLETIPPAPYLGLEDALESFVLADGYVIEPVASGKDVDLVVALAFDADGRAWTCEMRSYMPDLDGKGENAPTGRIRVLEDTDGDGRMDRSTVFIDGLVLPRAVAVTGDGCLFTSGDALYFVPRRGLKPVGRPVLVDAEYAKGGNVEHKANGLTYGHDNWYYNAKSDKRYRRFNGTWLREKTDFRGQWGISKDNFGRLYHNNNSTLLVGDWFRPQFFRNGTDFSVPVKMARSLGSNRVFPIRMTPGVNRAYMEGVLGEDGKLVNTTAACGLHIYRGDNFPLSDRGLAFICEPAGELIKAIRVERDAWNKPSGKHLFAEKEFLASTDEWFLPCNLYTGPDGTLWVVDMYFGLLQHRTYMTSYLRKQYAARGLDKPKASTGRIYRIRYADNPASAIPKLGRLSAILLIPFLAHTNGLHRDTAQRLIVESGDMSVVEDLNRLAADSSKPLGQIHALWTLEGLGAVSPAVLIRALVDKRSEVVSTGLDILAQQKMTGEALQASLNGVEKSPGNLHSLVRALGASKRPIDALELLKAHTEVPLLREAFVSGLGQRAANFRSEHGAFKDVALERLFAQYKSAEAAKVVAGPPLKGETKHAFQRGYEIYQNKAACMSCHGSDGLGLPYLGPPLRGSEWVTGDTTRLTKLILHGMTGPVTVSGTLYKPVLAMPGIGVNKAISDQDMADLLTFLRKSWGHDLAPVSAEQITLTRDQTKERQTPYKEAELR